MQKNRAKSRLPPLFEICPPARHTGWGKPPNPSWPARLPKVKMFLAVLGAVHLGPQFPGAPVPRPCNNLRTQSLLLVFCEAKRASDRASKHGKQYVETSDDAILNPPKPLVGEGRVGRAASHQALRRIALEQVSKLLALE